MADPVPPEVLAQRHARVREFFGRGSSYLEKDFGLRVRATVVSEFVGEVGGSDILDVGCGDGSISRQFWGRGNRVTLFDISAAMLEQARARAQGVGDCTLEFVQGELLSQKFATRYDLILCLGVLAHVASPADAVQVLARHLKPGGRLVLQFTDHGRWMSRALGLYRFWATQRRSGYRAHRMSFREVEGWTAAAGLARRQFRRCELSLPGMGRLPNEMLFRFGLRTMRSPILSRLATDVIMLLERSH